MSSHNVIKVGTRKSELAMIQTNTIIEKLKIIHPDVEFEVVGMTSMGDRILDKALSKIGEKSLFTRELEDALTAKQVDFVVHSLKDLPTVLPDGLVIGCVNKRDDPFDAVVMHPKHKGETLETLPKGSVIGTSSLRRCAQIKRKYPHLKIKDIRGNLNTRFRKLDSADDYDAIILAAAGLDRMNWSNRKSQELSGDDWMYAVSQGAIAIECRQNDADTLKLLSPIHDRHTALACIAERAYLQRLEGGCSVPISTFTEITAEKMFIRGGVYSTDGTKSVEEEAVVFLNENSESRVHDTDGNNSQDHNNDSESQSNGKISGVYSCIVGGTCHDQKEFATSEKLGYDLADKMIELGADKILVVAKRKAAEAIEEERAIKKARIGNGTPV